MRTISNRANRGFTLLELMVVIAILVAMAGLVVPMIGDQNDTAKQIAREASLAGLRDGFVGNASAPGLYADVRYVPGFDVRNLRMSHLFQADNGLPLSVPDNFPTYDAASRKGWRGPYVRGGNPIQIFGASNATAIFPASGDRRFDGDATFGARGFYLAPYGHAGDAAVGDEWGNPIVLQIISLPSNPTAEELATAWKYARLVSAGPNGVIDTPFSNTASGLLAGRLGINDISDRNDDIVVFLNRADVYEP